MRQIAKSKTKHILTVAPEAPPVVITKRKKVSKPRGKEDAVCATESPVAGRERPSQRKAAAAKPDVAESPVRQSTKKSQLIALLSTKTGTDITSISTALGWQTHTTRAALTMLRKAGYAIEATKPMGGGGGLYRIVAGPAPSRTAA